jgi:hypothetical protein
VADLERTCKERGTTVNSPRLATRARVAYSLVSDVHMDIAHARYIHRPCHASHRYW